MSHVVVVTGAGASFDCASDWIEPDQPRNRPPLTKDLFSDDWKPTLTRYPLVRQAAGDIRQAMRAGGADAVALEDYLRERMAASTSPPTHRRFRQVPLYLQDVLTQANQYTREPDNYNVLVSAALELDESLFLTLNYDTLLDTRFEEYWPAADRDWYVQADERWSLVKLHGSVNWGWQLPLNEEHRANLSVGGVDAFNAVVDSYAQSEFPDFTNDDIELLAPVDLDQRRWDVPEYNAVYYPALAVPLGPHDELVCPPNHVQAAREALDRMDGVNLLVIGYSGLDREVLGLFSESGNSIRRMLVANGSHMAETTVKNIADAFGENTLSSEWATENDFSRLVRSGELRRWMSDCV